MKEGMSELQFKSEKMYSDCSTKDYKGTSLLRIKQLRLFSDTENSQGYPVMPLFFIYLDILTRVMWSKKEIKRNQGDGERQTQPQAPTPVLSHSASGERNPTLTLEPDPSIAASLLGEQRWKVREEP